MKNEKSEAAIIYMLRHYLNFNVTDPMTETDRGSTPYTSYFSGDNTAGQINYLELKVATGNTPTVSVYVGGAWVVKTATTHYTLNTATGEILWTAYTPPAGNDNIKMDYTAIKGWIYDDHPNFDSHYFPRMTVLLAGNEREDSGQGIYGNYYSSPGQLMDHRVKIIVRHRRNTPTDGYIYSGIHLQNRDLVLAIAKQATDYLVTHNQPVLWKFWNLKLIREEPIFSEEDTDGIIRQDITLSAKIYEGG